MKRLTLASSSPRRRELVRHIGLSFEIARPDIDETPLPNEPSDAYVARLSHEKAFAAPVNGQGLILSADTTVVLDGQIVGKPADPPEAEAMLRDLCGKRHLVHTGITIRDVASGKTLTTVTTTDVYMREYSAHEISAYVASGEPFDKAGGYAVQDANFRPVERLEGCQTNVMGLPLCTVCQMLAQFGVQAPEPPSCSPEQLPCCLTQL